MESSRKPKRFTVSKTAKRPGQQLVTKKQVKQMILSDQELKHFEFSISPVAISYSGSIYSLTDIPQGDDDQSRDGDTLKLYDVQSRYSIVVGDATNIMRVLIFKWDAPSTPTVAGVIEDAGGNPYSALSSIRHDARQYLHILHDRLHTVSTSNSIVHNVVWQKLKGSIQYQTASTTGSRKVYLLIISDSAAATHPTFTAYNCVRFTDS